MQNSFEAAASGMKKYNVCGWNRGATASFMSDVFGKPEVKQVKCLANRNEHCEFMIQSKL